MENNYPLKDKNDFITLYIGVVLIILIITLSVKDERLPQKQLTATIVFFNPKHLSEFQLDYRNFSLNPHFEFENILDSLVSRHYKSGLGYDVAEFREFVADFLNGVDSKFYVRIANSVSDHESVVVNILEFIENGMPLPPEAGYPHDIFSLSATILYNVFYVPRLEIFIWLTAAWTIFFGFYYGPRVLAINKKLGKNSEDVHSLKTEAPSKN